MISSGTCVGNGMRTIDDKEECEEAARELGLQDTTATVAPDSSSSHSYPQGCYERAGQWLNLATHLSQKGHGADSERHPICAKTRTYMFFCFCFRLSRAIGLLLVYDPRMPTVGNNILFSLTLDPHPSPRVLLC